MTYVVTENCIKCKYMDCVEVCPVDCFYEGENMLVIHPDECIDCGVCEPECPAEAIVPASDDRAADWAGKSQDQERPKNNIFFPSFLFFFFFFPPCLLFFALLVPSLSFVFPSFFFFSFFFYTPR